MNNKNKGKSDSAVFRSYFLELMQDGRPHSRTEIMQAVQARAQRTFTTGVISGCLKSVVDQYAVYGIRRVDKGEYQQDWDKPPHEPTLEEQLAAAIDSSIDQLKGPLVALDVLEFDERTLKLVRLVKEWCHFLEKAKQDVLHQEAT